MRLLVVTQAVDAGSSTMGFFVEWIREFSRQCEEVSVVGLAVGRHDLPANVRVLSMGKERGTSRPARLMAYWKHLRAELPHVDGVFIHMCPEYLIAGWPFFALARKRVVLWYAHRHRDWKVRLAAAMADLVATSVENALTVKTAKKRPLGQGVPMGLFAPATRPPSDLLVGVGRISPIKRWELFIEAVARLKARGTRARLEIWGEPIMQGDRAYRAKLETLAAERGVADLVAFKGAAPFTDFPRVYAAAAAAVNGCPKGAVDKAGLEGMAAGLPLVAVNPSFAEIYGPDAPALLANEDPDDIADKLAPLLGHDVSALGARLRASVERSHSLATLVSRALALYR